MIIDKKLIITKLSKDVKNDLFDNTIYQVYNFSIGTINRFSLNILNDSEKLHKLALEEKKIIVILYIAIIKGLLKVI